jgi:hypothetical protein
MKPVCTANMDIVNSEKDVIDSITVKCALNLRHVNQQKLAENDIPKTVGDRKQKKGCQFGSECAYYHKANKDVNQPCECQSKLNILENIVTEMTNMIVNQEKKIDDMKAVLTEERELKEKVKLLEAVVQKMFVNVIKLEAEIDNKKITIKDNDIIVEANDDKTKCKSKQENSFREDGNNQKPNYK